MTKRKVLEALVLLTGALVLVGIGVKNADLGNTIVGGVLGSIAVMALVKRGR